MKRLKQFCFWVHLTLGVAGGLVIATLAFTGAMMAFEPQILELVDSKAQRVTPIPDAPRLSAQDFMNRMKAKHPGKHSGGMVLSSDPTQPVLVEVAEAHALSFHPQTGEIVGERTPSNVFTKMLLIHLRLSAGKVGGIITMTSNACFFLLCLTGLYLWWPKTWAALKQVTRFNFTLRGKALSWNLHNVAGFWALAVLLIITTTGLIMSCAWANDLLYTLTGSAKPKPAPMVNLAPDAQHYPLNEAVAKAATIAPGWETLAVFVPGQNNGVYNLIVREAGAGESEESRLYLHGGTGEVLRWEPYKDFSLGRKLRSYVLALHRGSIAGILGRTVAFLATLAALTLVVTGYVLSLKRFIAYRRRRAEARG